MESLLEIMEGRLQKVRAWSGVEPDALKIVCKKEKKKEKSNNYVICVESKQLWAAMDQARIDPWFLHEVKNLKSLTKREIKKLSTALLMKLWNVSSGLIMLFDIIFAYKTYSLSNCLLAAEWDFAVLLANWCLVF